MAHKKALGSSKNGTATAEGKRLGVKKFGRVNRFLPAILLFVKEALNSTPATMLVSVKMTHCLLSSMVKFNSNPTEETENKLAFTLYKIKNNKKSGLFSVRFFI